MKPSIGLACLILCLTVPSARAADALIPGEPLDQVLLRVKQEVGLYQAESATWRESLPALFRQLGVAPQCGSGDINFLLKEIRMEFNAVLDRTDKAHAGLKVPFGSAEAGVGGATSSHQTQTLTYTYYVPDRMQPDPQFKDVIGDQAVILPTLRALRTSLILATAQRPCMANTPADRNNTFTFGLELTRSANADVGFTFAVVHAGGGTERQSGSGNTITVTFHPTPTPAGPTSARPTPAGRAGRSD